MNLVHWSFHIRDIGVAGISSLVFRDPDQIRSIMKSLDAKESWSIVTCNRVEYLFVLNKKIPTLPPFTNIKPTLSLTKISQIVEHLLNVSCALDSMVFGENQILGQMKESYDWALKNKLCGQKLSQLLNKILKEAKLIRSETNLNSLNTSVSGVAGKLLLKDLTQNSHVLLVGASKTNQLLAQTLLKKGIKNISITNRTDHKSKLLAKTLKVNNISWADYLAGNTEAHALCFATAAGKNLLGPEQIKKIKPKIVLDLSMPANTDSDLLKKFKIKLVGLEKIQNRLEHERERTEKLKQLVETKIKLAKTNILYDIATLDLNHIISKSLEKSKIIQSDLIEKQFPIQNLTEDQKQAFERWTQSLVNKLNHVHIITLKDYVTKTASRDSHE